MKTKTIITILLLLFSITSFAQKMEYKTIKDLEEGDKISDIYTIDLNDKTLKIRFEDGEVEEYKIYNYEIEKNQEDEDVYGESNGVKFTRYYIDLVEEELDPIDLLYTISHIELMFPEKPYGKKYNNVLAVKYRGRLSPFYYSVIEK